MSAEENSGTQSTGAASEAAQQWSHKIDEILEKLGTATAQVKFLTEKSDGKPPKIKLRSLQSDMMMRLGTLRDNMDRLLKHAPRETLKHVISEKEFFRLTEVLQFVDNTDFSLTPRGNGDPRLEEVRSVCEACREVLEDIGLGGAFRKALEAAQAERKRQLEEEERMREEEAKRRAELDAERKRKGSRGDALLNMSSDSVAGSSSMPLKKTEEEKPQQLPELKLLETPKSPTDGKADTPSSTRSGRRRRPILESDESEEEAEVEPVKAEPVKKSFGGRVVEEDDGSKKDAESAESAAPAQDEPPPEPEQLYRHKELNKICRPITRVNVEYDPMNETFHNRQKMQTRRQVVEGIDPDYKEAILKCKSYEDVRALERPSPTEELGNYLIWLVARLYFNDPELTEVTLQNIFLPLPREEMLIVPRLMTALLQTNRTLRILSLANTGFPAIEGGKMGEVLRRNTTLRVLNLDSNPLNSNSVVKIAEGLRHAEAIEELRMNNLLGVQEGDLSVENALADVMKLPDQPRSLTKIGYTIRDPAARNRIDRGIMRNHELKRKARQAEKAAAARAKHAKPQVGGA